MRAKKVLDEVKSVIDNLSDIAKGVREKVPQDAVARTEFWNGYMAALSDVKERIQVVIE